MKVVAVVGMAGAGKSEVTRMFEERGYKTVRFGDITDEGLKNKRLEQNEENERYIRELLRKEHGMAAYAELSLPGIDNSLKSSNVVIDGLYSWEEYVLLKEYYGRQLTIVAVWASPAARHTRLTSRKERPLTRDEAHSRDKSEIENVNKGGPIAMADFTIINEASMEELRKETERVLSTLK